MHQCISINNSQTLFKVKDFFLKKNVLVKIIINRENTLFLNLII